MRIRSLALVAGALLASSVLVANPAQAKGRLTVYCSATNIMCETITKAFSDKYDVKTSFIRNGSGSTFAKVEAERKNPQADVWYGGTFDPQAQAGELGLLEKYSSPELKNIIEKFRDPAKVKGYTHAVYMGILGWGVNMDRLKKLGIEKVPQTWEDLLDPRFKNEIQIADPQSSGTAYTAIATLVQLMGEEKAFDYLKALHKNVSQYTKSGVTPSQNAARGETLIGIGFLHDYALQKLKGAPLELVVPKDGTGYELGGVSILKGARNLDNAKLFVDFVLSKDAQELAWKKGEAHQILTNTLAQQSPVAFDPSKLKLIDYDFATYSSDETRSRLINEWLEKVKLGK